MKQRQHRNRASISRAHFWNLQALARQGNSRHRNRLGHLPAYRPVAWRRDLGGVAARRRLGLFLHLAQGSAAHAARNGRDSSLDTIPSRDNSILSRRSTRMHTDKIRPGRFLSGLIGVHPWPAIFRDTVICTATLYAIGYAIRHTRLS